MITFIHACMPSNYKIPGNIVLNTRLLKSGCQRLVVRAGKFFPQHRTTGHWMATGKAWGLASSLWEALLAWGAGGGPVEATAPTASTATY